MTLTAKDIHDQLHQLLGFQPGVIVDCTRVGNQPVMDFVGSSRSTFNNPGAYIMLADKLAGLMVHLSEVVPSEQNKLVMLCDLFAEGNEPQPGVEWSHENRVKGAILGVMSCLLMLFRHPALQLVFAAQPESLVIATIENGKIVVQKKQGEKMVKFLQDNEKK